jgi:hypothetical protein
MSNTSLQRISKILALLVLLPVLALSQRSTHVREDTISSYLNLNITFQTKYRMIVDSAGVKLDTVAYLSDITSSGGYFKKVGNQVQFVTATDTLHLGYAQFDSLKAALGRFGIALADSLQLVSAGGDKATVTFEGTKDGNIRFPTLGSSGSGTVAMIDTNRHVAADTLKVPNPANGTYVNLVNGTGVGDTTIDILGMLGGLNIGIRVTAADVTNTNGTLTDDGYLFATIGGTTDHDIGDGSIWSGYLDLWYTVTSGNKVEFAFDLPDATYSVMDTFVDYMKDNGVGNAMTNPVNFVQGYVSGAGQEADFGTSGSKYLRLNFYLDNTYGYTGDLKLKWSSANGSSSVTLLKGSTLVGYRVQ